MDWRETFKNRFGDTFRLCCDDKTLQGGVESFIENLLAKREKEIAEEVGKLCDDNKKAQELKEEAEKM